MNMKAELRIYGVSEYFTQPNANEGDFTFYDYDNEEIEGLSDEVFMKVAENNGNVWSLYALLRDIEANNFGAKSFAIKPNMQFRAYLINIENETVNPIRIDINELLIRVTDTGYTL